ncbi:type II secretion system protein [Bdellovibrio sp.]|uniref:type II secretion system protein n=1 Tax=Bdellovibrio sp. TaxID=28201 RepID=UPI0039E56445
MAFRKNMNSEGFGLVEVLVALGIVGVASAAILSLLVGLSGHMRSADSKASELVLANEISQVVSEEERCTRAVIEAGEQKIDITKPFKIKLKLPASGDLYEGVKFGSNLEVKEFFIDSFEPMATDVAGKERVVGVMWLKTNDSAAGGILRKRRSLGTISLIYERANKNILSCFSHYMDPGVSCKSLGLNWNSENKTCRQPANVSCEDIGGAWVNGKCVISHLSNNVSIIGKSCSGANIALVGFDGGGNPICKTLTASAGEGSGLGGGTSSASSADTGVAGCRGGNTNVPSPDGTNQCYFEWGSVSAGMAISVGGPYLSASSGGLGKATCKGNDKWDYQYACPSLDAQGKTTKTICQGGYQTGKSPDGSNTCSFQWGQGTEGQSINIKGTNGGTGSGHCLPGVGWEFSVQCPSKVAAQADCPGGGLSYGKCYFTWDQTPAGQSPRNMRDISGRGATATGIICKNGSWDTSGHKVSGSCN